MNAAPLSLLALADGGAAAALPQLQGRLALLAGAVVLLGVLGVAADVGLLAAWRRNPPDWNARMRDLQARAWSPAEAAIVASLLLALFALVGLAHAGAVALGWNALADNDRFWLLLQSVTFHWTGLALVVVLLRRRRASWRETFGLQRRGAARQLGLALLFYLAALPALFLFTGLYQAALRYVGLHPTLQDSALLLTDPQPLWMRAYLLLLGIALGPLVEELLFRGLILPVVARYGHAGSAAVLVSAFFALIHAHVPSLVPLFVIALAFALGYIYSGSLLVPVAMHGLFNAVNLGLMFALRGS